ncbi:Phytochrome-like protein cph1 [Planctomyces sp. SH-PL14]|nr:Phytochrome-like protein cph1 [Planctomyces sp. SH-PL14]
MRVEVAGLTRMIENLRESGVTVPIRPVDSTIDLSNCDREPIRLAGSIQPHGVLFVLRRGDLKVLQVSRNAEAVLDRGADEILGRTLDEILGPDRVAPLRPALLAAPHRARPTFLSTLEGLGRSEHSFHAIAHESDGGIVLELELADGEFRTQGSPSTIHARTDTFTLRAEEVATAPELAGLLCEEVRRLTGFDRVLVYRFDEGWNGTVVGEDGNGRLPSYLHHRFPASDIPAQARELYRINRIRLIPDAQYEPVPIVPAVNPETGEPLDMSFSTLRSVSPIHVQYMRNMETASSMSVSILKGGKLWGLISSHHHAAKGVSFPDRITCDILSRAFSLRLSAIEQTEQGERKVQVQSTYSKLLGVMSERGDFASALREFSDDFLRLVDAPGAAIVTADGCELVGRTPAVEMVRRLAAWAADHVDEEVYATDSLSQVWPEGRSCIDTASGLLAIRISSRHPSFVFWFRPEVIQTVQWGGNPAKPVTAVDGETILHPRRSFETWKETVSLRATPWNPSEIEGARQLRDAIVGTVLRRAEELADLNTELTRSNKELEAFSYSVSHDLRAPLRHIVGYAEMLRESAAGRLSATEDRWVNNIIESSEYAGQLVDKLLGYSRLGRAELQVSSIPMETLVREVQAGLARESEGREIVWTIGELPTVQADLMMLRMAVRDLLANAVKYTRQQPHPHIEIACRDETSEHVFFVRDNGIGFDMAYVDKLFGVFQRLHKWEDYEGTGIGLANVRRVIERHGGRTWAEGQEGRGATFYFTLPRQDLP